MPKRQGTTPPEPEPPPADDCRGAGPGEEEATIRIGDFPQLRLIAWNMDPDVRLTAEGALSLYERNWRHVDQGNMPPHERELLERLVLTAGNGVLHV